MEAGRYRIGVIGAGRLGRALSRALSAAGVAVSGPFGRGQPISAESVDIVVLCVPDREIGPASAMVPPGPLVGHCSGLLPPSALGDREAFAFHPLMTLTHDSGAGAFHGAAAAVSGSTPRALDAALALAHALSMEPITVRDEDRALYHATASMASNYLVTLESAAEQLAGVTGVERRHLLVLARAALENWGAHGSAALTGPIARGDDATVSLQRAAVAAAAPDLLNLWDALARSTRRLATASSLDASGAA